MSVCGEILLLAVITVTTMGAPAGDKNSTCTTYPATVGEKGSMTFYFRQDLNMASDTFIAYVIRTNDTANVLQCDRKNEAPVTCEVINSAFEPTAIEDYSLTVTAPRVTEDLAGTYTLWTHVDGTKEPPVACSFVVITGTEGLSNEKDNNTIITIVVVVVVIIALVAVAVGILAWFIKFRKRPTTASDRPQDQVDDGSSVDPHTSGEAGMPLLPLKDENMRWYFEQIPEDEDADLLHFWRNGPGSFLITHDKSAQDCLILAVHSEGVIKHFRINNTECGFEFEDAKTTFSTLSELVDFYKKHDIEIEGKPCGKLTKPFQLKPSEKWYFGKMGRQAAKRLLRSSGDGSFLIRDSVTKPSCYTLALHHQDKTYGYLIEVEDDGFKFSDASTKFPTLSALVKHYQENNIQIGNKSLGQLGRPATRKTCCACL